MCLMLVGIAALDGGDVALVEKGVGGRDSVLEIAARVVAQVEDKAEQLAAGFLPKILHRGGERRRGAVVKTGQPQIADIAVFDPRRDGLELLGARLTVSLIGALSAR